MAKYQLKIELDPRIADGGLPQALTLEELEVAVKTGLAAQLGDRYNVKVYDIERSDAD